MYTPFVLNKAFSKISNDRTWEGGQDAEIQRVSVSLIWPPLL